MDANRLAHIEDVTRRYGKYRPCGAGLGVVWGGVLLGGLGLMSLVWTRQEYLAHAAPSQTFWRFLRDTALIPPAWLQVAAVAAPFVAWAGLVAIQAWVDRQFGAVTALIDERDCRRPRGPRWMPAFVVILIAAVLSGILIWDGLASTTHALLAMIAIAAWVAVWGRGSRDHLTMLVMMGISVPSMYLMAGTDPDAHMAAGNLLIFAAYFTLMLWLVFQGIVRFAGFREVHADLTAMEGTDQ